MANCNLLAHPFKLILTSIIFFLFISSSNGQNEIECISPQKPISKFKLTINNYGIGLGGLNKLNGLNLSLIDKTCKINGLSVSLSNNFESYKTINDIDITLLSYIEKCRGLGFALGGEINELNGLATFLLFGTTWDFNGINISGLAQLNSNISKGAVISGLYIVNSQFTGLAITPGFIVSDMTNSIPEKIKTILLSKIPMGKMGSGDDVSNCVAFLSSDEASYITGETIHVNGGMYMA